MKTLKEQLEKIVGKAKFLKEEVAENEDVTLGTIDKCLNEEIERKIKEVLGE
jgi:hypothetical protein